MSEDSWAVNPAHASVKLDENQFLGHDPRDVVTLQDGTKKIVKGWGESVLLGSTNVEVLQTRLIMPQCQILCH